MITLRQKYIKNVIPAMQKKFGYKNPFAVPKIEKVLLNTGFGKIVAGKSGDERKKIEEIIFQELASISGQKPILTLAKQSISSFKLRKGMAIGAKITLRKKRMWDFLARLINIVLPRTRDFHGINQEAIDKQGNLTIGIREHITFPEILPEKARLMFGLEIVVVTTARAKEEGLELLKLIGFPVKQET